MLSYIQNSKFIMSKLNYLNVGCGGKFHTDWVNIDVVSQSPHVIQHDITKGLPFKDNTFEVVYHSQVLEHFHKKEGTEFIRECFRVLKPGGIIRIVVPDLENIIREYLKLLEQNLNNPSPEGEENYKWILLELFDQTWRNHSGGGMSEYLGRPELLNEKYITERCGFNATHTRKYALKAKNTLPKPSPFRRLKSSIKKIFLPSSTDALMENFLSSDYRNFIEVGKFRLGGEVHYHMYDRYSLSELLTETGFKKIKNKSPFESEIPEWGKYSLDVKDKTIYDPTSLFIEAVKE